MEKTRQEAWPGCGKAAKQMEEFGKEVKKHVCSYCGELHEPGDCVYEEGMVHPHFGAWPNPPRLVSKQEPKR